MTSSSTALPADPAVFKIPGGRAKTEEAVKTLAAIIKLYDTVLQSMSQLRSLAVVEEKEVVRLANEGLEAYFHAHRYATHCLWGARLTCRCFHLARLHCIHPTPTFSSAVQLLERSADLVAQARTSLFDPSFPLQEEIVDLPESKVADLEIRVKALDLAAKRALFAERVTKPVFFDNAFNYIDLPMDELMVKAGRTPAVAEKPSAAAQVAESVVQQVEKAAEEVKKTVVGRERTRESTPAASEQRQEEKPKGWLGGWFGRG
jgi:signal recognition particle subunit SRP68